LPAAPQILIANGPNLNLLGEREPAVYGRERLADIAKSCAARAKERGLKADFRQTNSEAELIGWCQDARKSHGGIIINAGALTHTSIALMDALLAVSQPVIEVHLSNIFRREAFRRHSYVALAAKGTICGLGAHGYLLALDAMARLLETEKEA
jgi:3-dehydroquinate dehydratase II